MPPSREENSRESSNNTNNQVPAPSSSQFTAVNGANRANPENRQSPSSTIQVTDGSEGAHIPERDYNLVPDRRGQSADSSPRISSPLRTHSRSHSQSLSGSGEEAEDTSEVGSSNLQSPITPKSQFAPHNGPKALPPSKQFAEAGDRKNGDTVAEIAPAHKRKRSQSPHPYPPHPRTDKEMTSAPETQSSNNPFSNNGSATATEFRRAGSHSGPDVARPLDGMERAPSSDGGAPSERSVQPLKQEASNSAPLPQDQAKRSESQSRDDDISMTESQQQQQQQQQPAPPQSTPQGSTQQLSQDPNRTFDASGANVTPSGGVRIVDHKRKRVFSNRTKTGCITCRRRKKKCDEGKPECNNCRRGGFICEGYSGKINWQKPPVKTSAQTPLQPSKQDVVVGTSSGSPVPVAATIPPVMPPSSAPMQAPVVYQPNVPRPGERDAPLPPIDYPMVHAQEHAFPGAPGMPLAGPQPPMVPPPFPGVRTNASHPIPARFSASEKEKMLNGELYHAFTPELVDERERCRAACWRFNNAANPNLGIAREERFRLFIEILRPSGGTRGFQPGWPGDYGTPSNGGNFNKRPGEGVGYGGYPLGEEPVVEAPFTCDYGYNIKLGNGVFINYGCTIVDTCSVTIKARSIIGPNVNIYAGSHPIDPRVRAGMKGPEFGKPVVIEEDCWIAGNVTILPGVKVGKGSTVGAGSVVTRDVPPHTVVAGNPAKVIKGVIAD